MSVRLSVRLCVTDISSFAKARIPRRRWEPSDRKPSTPHSQFDRWSGADCSMRWRAHSNGKSGQNGWSGHMLRTCTCAKRVRKGIVEGLHQPSQNEPKTKSVGTRTNFAGRHVRTVQCGKMSPVASPGHGFGRDAACHVARLRRTAAAGKGGCGVVRGRLVTGWRRATGVRRGAAARIITARRRGARGPPRCSAAMHRRAASR